MIYLNELNDRKMNKRWGVKLKEALLTALTSDFPVQLSLVALPKLLSSVATSGSRNPVR